MGAKRKRRSGNCQKCGGWRPWLQRDHIIPRFKGGSDDSSNIQYLCANCHEDKTMGEWTGKKVSEETRLKISLASMGNPGFQGKHTEEAKKVMSQKATGRRHDEDTKRRIGEAFKGNQYALGNVNGPRPEEVKEKIREKLLGVEHSEERKANQAKAAAARFSDPAKKAAWYEKRWGKKLVPQEV